MLNKIGQTSQLNIMCSHHEIAIFLEVNDMVTKMK